MNVNQMGSKGMSQTRKTTALQSFECYIFANAIDRLKETMIETLNKRG